MTESTSVPSVVETDEQRYARQREQDAAARKAAEFTPTVGALVYRTIPDPFVERTPENRYSHPTVSIALTITKTTATTFTVDDGSRYKLATGTYQSNLQCRYGQNGEPNSYYWSAKEIGHRGTYVFSVVDEGQTVYTKAELDAKLKETAEEKAEAASKARREKLAVLGVSRYVSEIFDGSDYSARVELRGLRDILTTDEEKQSYADTIEDIAIDATRSLRSVGDNFARIARDAERQSAWAKGAWK